MKPQRSRSARKQWQRVPARKRGRVSSPPSAESLIFARTRTPAFERYLKDLLLRLCRVDTTPNPDPQRMAAAESECFRILEEELASFAVPGARLERRPINPGIAGHPAFSLLHFTKTADRPAGLAPAETYHNRSNLLYRVPGTPGPSDGRSIALNAHLDVVAPYFPPTARGGVVLGRGACDDKGPVVGIVGALRIVSDVLRELNLPCNRNVLAMFVVEEETGGNGSLSLALDPELKPLYDAVLVSECTGLQIHPANRGAVWYRAEVTAPPGLSPLELAVFVIEELEAEGAAIRAESRHPLFPQRPVQTCHGIIGSFGEHPSRICSRVSFDITFPRPRGAEAVAEALLTDCLEAGLARYVGLYGDKTKIPDPASTQGSPNPQAPGNRRQAAWISKADRAVGKNQSGKPMVAVHYELVPFPDGFRVTVHGAAGHMGSIRERDGAITKMAFLVRSLMSSRARLEAAFGGPFRLGLHGSARHEPRACASDRSAQTLILEGGQGFVPTHPIEEVMDRLRRAVARGFERFLLARPGVGPAGSGVGMTYEKLHNAAYDGDPESPTMRNALLAAETCGLNPARPPVGWTVSCDARLFATENPGMPVLTFGPGELLYAHSDQEQIRLEDLRRAVEVLAVFLLRETGTLELPMSARDKLPSPASPSSPSADPKGRARGLSRP